MYHLSRFIGALSYAEIGTVVNKSGGEFSFYQSAFAGLHPFWGPLPSFIHSWVCTMFVRPTEVAIIVLTFAEYVVQPITLWANMTPEETKMLKKIISIVALGKYVMLNKHNTYAYKIIVKFYSFKSEFFIYLFKASLHLSIIQVLDFSLKFKTCSPFAK